MKPNPSQRIAPTRAFWQTAIAVLAQIQRSIQRDILDAPPSTPSDDPEQKKETVRETK